MHQQPRHKNKKAFTLLELLIAIAIIGILSGIVLVSLSSAREKSRDTKRKAELKQVQLALEDYFSANGTYVVAGSGSGGTGTGWLAYQDGAAYITSVSQALMNRGYFNKLIVDPSGVITSSGGRSGYMIQSSATAYTLWANLENPSTTDSATLNTCRLSGYDGYSVSLPVSARMNFCISN